MPNRAERKLGEAPKPFMQSLVLSLRSAQGGYTHNMDLLLEAAAEDLETLLSEPCSYPPCQQLQPGALHVCSKGELRGATIPREGREHRKYTPANQGEVWETCRCHWGADHGADGN